MNAIREAILMLFPPKKYETLTGSIATPQAHVPRRPGRLPFRRMPGPARAVQVAELGIVDDGSSEDPEETSADLAEAEDDAHGQPDDFGVEDKDNVKQRLRMHAF